MMKILPEKKTRTIERERERQKEIKRWKRLQREIER